MDELKLDQRKPQYGVESREEKKGYVVTLYDVTPTHRWLIHFQG